MVDTVLDALPDMTLNFEDERINVGDSLAYITKHRQWQQELEDWSGNLVLYVQALLTLLNEAKQVPNDIRLALTQLVLDAQIAAQQCASVAAGLNLPAIDENSKGKVLMVKEDGTGYGVIDVADLVTTAIDSALDSVAITYVEEM